MRIQFDFLGRRITLSIKLKGDFRFSFRITKLENIVIGFCSNLDKLPVYHPKARHLLMLDFDDKLPLEELKKKIRELQRVFCLGDCEIFESSPNKYHGYFFGDAFHYFHCCQIIHYAVNEGMIDEAFARWRMIRPNIVLRFSIKSGFIPKYVTTVKSPYKKEPIKWFRDYVYEMLKIEEEKNKKLNIDTSKKCIKEEEIKEKSKNVQ